MFAQNSNPPPSTATDRAIRNGGFDWTTQRYRGEIIDSTLPVRMPFADSLVNLDTNYVDFQYQYWIERLTVTNSLPSNDTISVAQFADTKGDYSTNAIGLININTGIQEANCAMIIIPADTTYTWKFYSGCIGKVRIMTLSNRARTIKFEFEGIR